MENNSRVHNSVRNIIVSVSYQFIIVILSFISRKIFINVLGIEFLGINGLFTNILAVFSLAELGIGNAIIYSMYSAINQNDTKKLNGLTNYYKKLYRIIAIAIFIIGICLIPFLKYIVKLDNPISHLEFYYFIFLIDSVFSYLFIYKTSIVIANQKEYKLKYFTIVFSILRVISQIVVLLCTKKYIMYLIVKVLFVFIENVVKSNYSEKMYPYIKEKTEITINEKKSIWNNIKSLFFYQIGGVILNNTDNILISMLVGTITVGLYSNYTMIVSNVMAFTSLIFTSIQSSIGSFNAENDDEKKFFIFNVLDYVSFWVFGFCSICFWVLFDDFIILYLGETYLLTKEIVLVCIINFYLQGVLYPIWCFRHTTELFKYTKYTMVYASIINIVLSILLGIKWGLFGILIATAISRLLTSIWYEPFTLFKKLFKKSSFLYYKNQIVKLLVITSTFIITSVVSDLINFSNLYLNFILKILICIIIPNGLFYIITRNRLEFKYLYEKMKGMILKKI